MTQDDPLAGLADALEDAVPAPRWHLREPELDPEGKLRDELTCRGCGYNLHRLAPDADCPECGLDVKGSALGDRLQFADLGWLRSLRQGLNWYLIAIFISIALSLIQLLVVFTVVAPNFGRRSGESVVLIVSLVFVVLRLLLAVLFVLAVWKLTRPDPAHQFRAKFGARSLFRWGWITSFVLGFLGGFISAVQPAIGTAVFLAALLPGCVGMLAMFVYFRELALRVPDRNLARRTRAIFIGGLSCLALVFLVIAVGWLLDEATMFSTRRRPGWFTAFSYTLVVMFILSLIGLLALGLAWLVTLVHYQSRLARAVQLARRNTRHA